MKMKYKITKEVKEKEYHSLWFIDWSDKKLVQKMNEKPEVIVKIIRLMEQQLLAYGKLFDKLDTMFKSYLRPDKNRKETLIGIGLVILIFAIFILSGHN